MEAWPIACAKTKIKNVEETKSEREREIQMGNVQYFEHIIYNPLYSNGVHRHSGRTTRCPTTRICTQNRSNERKYMKKKIKSQHDNNNTKSAKKIKNIVRTHNKLQFMIKRNEIYGQSSVCVFVSIWMEGWVVFIVVEETKQLSNVDDITMPKWIRQLNEMKFIAVGRILLATAATTPKTATMLAFVVDVVIACTSRQSSAKWMQEDIVLESEWVRRRQTRTNGSRI